MTLGPRLRELRQRAGRTQLEQAERAGVSVRAVRDIESGRVAHPRSSSVERIADALGLSDRDRTELRLYSREAGVPAVAILGPLEAREGRIGSPVQRTILGLLALHSGRRSSGIRSSTSCGATTPPRTCLTQLQVAIGRLRDLFELRRGRASGTVIASTPNRYRLCVETDVLRFEELMGEGRVEEALDLWRGPVLAGGVVAAATGKDQESEKVHTLRS